MSFSSSNFLETILHPTIAKVPQRHAEVFNLDLYFFVRSLVQYYFKPIPQTLQKNFDEFWILKVDSFIITYSDNVGLRSKMILEKDFFMVPI